MNQMRILIADPKDHFRSKLRRKLKAEGHFCEIARSSLRALEFLRRCEKDFHILITDLNLEGALTIGEYLKELSVIAPDLMVAVAIPKKKGQNHVDEQLAKYMETCGETIYILQEHELENESTLIDRFVNIVNQKNSKTI
ncbi:hypothetical protein ACFL54_01280 [Planctomycetota bacterium]